MLLTWFFKFSLHPYYSSRIGWNILLYESFWSLFELAYVRSCSKFRKISQKLNFSFFFLWALFFSNRLTFSQAEAWAAAASRAAAENFFTFIAFFVYFNLKIWSKLENFNFSKMIKFDHFFVQNVKPSFAFSTSIKPIDTLFLLHGMSFDKNLSGNGLKTKFKCKNYLQISILNP